MAIPGDAKIFAEAIDPTDIVDLEINVAPLLEIGEAVASHTEVIPAESSLLGLQLKTTGGYITSITGNILRIWVEISSAEQNNIAFIAGATLPIELTIITDSVPPRKKQRTVAIKVRQR